MRQIKFSLQELLGVGFTLVVLGVGIAYGMDVTGDLRTDFAKAECTALGENYAYNSTAEACTNTTAQIRLGNPEYNSTVDTVTGLSKITSKIPTIATVVVASVIIGILVTYLWARFARM